MKKVIIFVVCLIVVIFISDKLYKSYRLHNLTNDRAVIFTYINISPKDFADYFNIDKDELENPDDLFITCVVPNHESSFLINNRNNYPVESINCNQDYDFGSQYELRRSYINGYKLVLQLKNKNTQKKIAEKDIFPQWDYGKVNHIVIDKNKEYKYCSK